MKTNPDTIQVYTLSQTDDPIADWANGFYKAKRAENISPWTQTFYKQQLRHFLKFCEGQSIERISQITPGLIRDYLLWLGENGHNPGGQHAAYRVLKTFLRWYDNEAEPERWKNPIQKVKAPKLDDEPLDPVELETVHAMVKTCSSQVFYDLRVRLKTRQKGRSRANLWNDQIPTSLPDRP